MRPRTTPGSLQRAPAAQGFILRGVLRLRAAAFVVLVGALLAYYSVAERLSPWSTWTDIAWLAVVLIPAVFGLVLLALPLWRARGLLALGLTSGAAAFALAELDFDVASNFAKLGAMTALGFWFLGIFESVNWVALVALIIPWVDAYSVWRGPTHHIVTQRQEIFGAFSIAFPIPGEHASANLGLPDLLFFAVFLAAAARFRLRPGWTWLCLTLSFGATMALAVWWGAVGLPALPLLSAGFLLPNGDLLWRRLRHERAGTASTAS